MKQLIYMYNVFKKPLTLSISENTDRRKNDQDPDLRSFWFRKSDLVKVIFEREILDFHCQKYRAPFKKIWSWNNLQCQKQGHYSIAQTKSYNFCLGHLFRRPVNFLYRWGWKLFEHLVCAILNKNISLYIIYIYIILFTNLQENFKCKNSLSIIYLFVLEINEEKMKNWNVPHLIHKNNKEETNA